MKKLILFSLIVLVFSCAQSEEKGKKNNNSKAIETQTSKKPKIERDSSTRYHQLKSPRVIKFRLLDKPAYTISKLTFDGEIIHQKSWEDTNGENIVLFTKSKEELFTYHYSIIQGNVKLLRRVYDFVKDCDADLTLDFIENSIGVTDLDNNNLGEITFAYQRACISDVSPKQLKLLM